MANVIKKLIKNWSEYEIFATAWANIADASSSTKWLVKLWDDTVQSVAGNSVSSTSNRTYKIQVNSSWQLVVNVPWTDTTTSSATSTTSGTVKLWSDTAQSVAANEVSSTASRTYAVQVNWSGQMVINVPWTDTTYSEVTKSDMDTWTSTTAWVVAAKSIADYVTSKVSSVYKYKWSKATYADLPSTWNVTGDVWNVVAAYSTYPAGTNFAWDWTDWDALWWTVDLSNYVTLNWAQTITGTKTFSAEPVLPSKTTDATNTWTKPATEAQVYKVAQAIPTVYNSTITYTQAWDTITTSTTNQSSASTVALRGDIFLTQSAYTDLPSSKTTDWNTYIIYETTS